MKPVDRSAVARRAAANTRHGHARKRAVSAEYRVWSDMMQRCYRKASQAFEAYGGRGITVCDAWHDFAVFLADAGPKPSPKHSIDRIDVNGNYEPGNVRWATRAMQDRNRRTNRVIEIDGTRAILADWAASSPASAATIARRLDKGWDPAKAVHQPPGPQARKRSA